MVLFKKKYINLTIITLTVIIVAGLWAYATPSSSPSKATISQPNSYGLPGEAVDLGLSVLWCDRNIGATSPHLPGRFFGYGDIAGTQTSTKYADYISQDIVRTDHDPAYVYWGGGWRMPTASEINELCDRCEWKWIRRDNTEGFLVVGRGGKSIFLPTTGQKSGGVLNYNLTRGYYWSGEVNERDPNYASALFFYKGNKMVKDYRKIYAFCIRPVCESSY